MDVDGWYVKYKFRLVSKVFSQFHGVDYTKTFAPVAKLEYIRLVLSITTSKQWEVHHIYVTSDFIHGEIHEDIYMQ